MQEIGIREARRNLAGWIDQVEAGGEVVLLRHGRPVARLVPPRPEQRRLPPLGAFRASLGARSDPQAGAGAGDPHPRREPP